jgi:hypothetical protein
VTRDDTLFLVITGGVASQLENFCSKIFKDGGKVDYFQGKVRKTSCNRRSIWDRTWSTGTDTLSIVSFLQ